MRYTFIITLLIAFCLFTDKAGAQSEQEKLNLPGDNLNLYSTLKLFQDSKTLEGFEKSLNDEKSNINNLDLNGDNKIDYIRVVDNVQGNVHNITLKVAVSKEEDQNVAVFVVTKDKDGPAKIQVIGDEDLYGKDYIIEPTDEIPASTPNPGYKGTAKADNTNNNAYQDESSTWTEVNDWPLIRYIYVPSYSGWNSPWYWDNYPSYWQPWQPFYWHYYYGYQYHWNYYYNSHYRRWNNYLVPGWQQQYYGSSFRSRSSVVQARYNRGDYNNTYTRPALARKGAEVFKRENPTAPSVNEPLPSFDKKGKPIVNRQPNKPNDPISSRPAVIAPATRPQNPDKGLPPVTKPVIAESETRPLVTDPSRPAIAEPGVNPAKEPGRRPVSRPIPAPVSKPILNEPAINPVKNEPVTRPVVTDPARKPVVNEPVSRPSVRPPLTQQPALQPVPVKPIVRDREPFTHPARPDRSQPINRPDNQRPPVNNPVTRPPETRQPATNKPVFARPASINPPSGTSRPLRPKE